MEQAEHPWVDETEVPKMLHNLQKVLQLKWINGKNRRPSNSKFNLPTFSKSLAEHLLCARNYAQDTKMNKIWFLPSRKLIDLWEQREHILENKFYQREKSALGDFPDVYESSNILKVTMNLDFWEFTLCIPFLLSYEHSTKDKICMVTTKSSKGLWKLKDSFLLFIWIIQLSNSYICMQYL